MKQLLLKIRNKEPNPFDNFIFIVIIISSILIGIETDIYLFQQYQLTFHILDNIIILIFIIEIIIKMISFGKEPWKYFYDIWNLFDFVIVLLSFLPSILTNGQDDTHEIMTLRIIRLVRAIRIVRTLRIISHLRPLQIIVEALIKSLPSLSYVILLLGILFYIYGVLGVFLFGHYDPNHFGSLNYSILTLFECTAGSWVSLADDLLKINGITNTFLIPIYFISFYFIAGLIILNLFIGIIVTELSTIKEKKSQEDIIESFQDDLDIESNKIMSEIQKDVEKLNYKFKALQLSFDKNNLNKK